MEEFLSGMEDEGLAPCCICGGLCASNMLLPVVCWDCEDGYMLDWAIVIDEES
jgi:hypothetical protein